MKSNQRFTSTRPLMYWGAGWLLASWFVSHVVVFSQPRVLQATATDARQLAVIADPRLNESSGMAISRANRNRIWLHNDSGDEPRLFCIDFDGKVRAELKIAGAQAIDWEDLCSFTCDGKHWLLIADVGDNLRQRGNEQPGCRLYLVEEPVLPATETAEAGETVVTVRPHSVIALSWPNGPHDCEAVAVDPERREILLVTKGLLNDCSLYSGPLSLQAGTQSVTAKHLQRMLLPLVTGMDISSDSRQLAITTMMNAVVVTRESTDDWSTAAGRSPRTLTTPPRRQGETICFTADGSGLLLNSEFENQPLWYLPLTDNEPVR